MTHQDIDIQLGLQRELKSQRSAAPGALQLWSQPVPQEVAVLKEVIAIIRPQRWPQTKLRVQRLRLQAFTQQRVLGRGRARGLRYLPRQGADRNTGVRYLPKRMISWIVEEIHVQALVESVIAANRTGHIGDGKIFVLPVEGVVRLRTGERQAEALRAHAVFETVRGTAHGCVETAEVEHASGH